MLTLKEITETSEWPGGIVSAQWERDRRGWFKHIVRVLGPDFELEHLTKADIRRLQKTLYRETDDQGNSRFAAKSINQITHTVLRAAVRDFLDWPKSRRIDVWDDIRRVKGADNAQYTAWTLPERDALLNLAASIWRDKPEYTAFVEFLFGTGCRPSEACGLQWGDITWPTEDRPGSIHIARGRVKRVITAGKTSQAQRDLPLTDLAARGLARLDRRKDQDLVFTSPRVGAASPTPCPIDTHNFTNRHWSELMERAVAAKLITATKVLYACRHTFVSAIGAHLPIAEVAKLIGDQVKTTEQHYFRYLQPHNLDQINSLLGGGNSRHLAAVALAAAEANPG